MKDKVKVEISSWSIITSVLILALLYALFLIREVIALFFIVLILTATFRPIINRWEKRIKRIPAVLSLIILILLLIAFVFYVVFPPLINQLTDFILAIPQMLSNFDYIVPLKKSIVDNFQNISNSIGNLTGSFVNVTVGIFGGIFASIIAIVMTIYLLLDKNGLQSFIANVVPVDMREPISQILKKIATKVGNWFRGQMLLGLIIAVLYYIGLLIIGVPYALALAVISGILEFIPTIGPIISGVIALLVAFSVSPTTALFTAILFIVIQQLENTLIVPKIMQKAVGLSPVAIILAILIGAKLMGIIGVLLAVPIAASLFVLVQEWPSIKAMLNNND